MLGGGWVNTELRRLSEPRVFDYFDYVTLDDGERPLLNLLQRFSGRRVPLLRTYVRRDGAVALETDATQHDIPLRDTGTPTYAGLPLADYISVLEMLNPMHRLWSDGRWNKLTLAHGCYWKKCSFCDVSLDYIGRYDRAATDLIVQRIRALIAETGETGFHLVDEAAPPAAMRALAKRLLAERLSITWWGNIRFEKTFTRELCGLLANSGCVAVSGGLEVASDRLLALMKKGVTVAQVARVTRAFNDAGIMVHAYLMYGFPTETVQETVDALWDLVWKGLITNDTLHALRAYVRTDESRAPRRGRPAPFRSRRLVPPSAEGRWSIVETPRTTKSSATAWATAMAQQLLSRHGIVTREAVASEAVSGGFAAVYDVLKAMEQAGRIRRGYFAAGLGGAQFALPPALDLLRSLREPPEEPKTVVLASTDPANPYGSIVKWPDPNSGAARTVGSLVIIVDGSAAAYLRRGERELLLFAPEAEPQRSRVVREVARALLQLAASRQEGRRGMLIAEINGVPATAHPSARLFLEQGFAATAMGLQARVAPGLRAHGWRYSMTDNTRDDQRRDTSTNNPSAAQGASADRQERAGTTSETERESVRSSNDRDQAMEREGNQSEHSRGYDEAVTGRGAGDTDEEFEDVDPDSAESEIDRDDTVLENGQPARLHSAGRRPPARIDAASVDGGSRSPLWAPEFAAGLALPSTPAFSCMAPMRR